MMIIRLTLYLYSIYNIYIHIYIYRSHHRRRDVFPGRSVRINWRKGRTPDVRSS